MTAPKKVLIVDDHDDGRAALRALLELQGHEVTDVETGTAAVELIGTWYPEIVLLDLSLPDVDGIDIIERIRAQRTSHRPFIIAFTGRAELDARARAAGCDAFVLKPAEPGRLEALIAAVPGRPRDLRL